MKVIVTADFYDLAASVGRRAGDVIEVPEDRGARLIEMRFAKAEGAKPERRRRRRRNRPRRRRRKRTDPTDGHGERGFELPMV